MEIAGYLWQLLTQTKNVSPAKPLHVLSVQSAVHP